MYAIRSYYVDLSFIGPTVVNKAVAPGTDLFNPQLVPIGRREFLEDVVVILFEPLWLTASSKQQVVQFAVAVFGEDLSRGESGQFERIGLVEGQFTCLGQGAVEGIDNPILTPFADNLQLAVN